MQTECSADLFGFTPVERRKVVAAFDGGQMTSDAGAMLLGATDKQIKSPHCCVAYGLGFTGCIPYRDSRRR